MSAALAAPEKKATSPVEAFAMEVLPPERAQDVFAGLPSHIRPERFRRNLINALMQTPDLLKCDPRLVFREVSKVAQLGLLLDAQMGEAYLILGWNNRAQRSEPQLRVGYRGLIKLARQSGDVAQVYAHEVCEHDDFHVELGTDKRLTHRPAVFGNRGSVIGYYAVVKYADGSSDFEPMAIDDIHRIRDRSDGWKAFKAGKIKSTPWSTDEAEMAKKTVIRRLMKRLPQSPELADAVRHEDEAEFSGPSPVALRAPPPRTLIGRLDALAAPVRVEPDHIDHEPHEAAEHTPPPPAPDAGADRAPIAEVPASDLSEGGSDGGALTLDQQLAELEARLSFAKTEEEVEEAYSDFDAGAVLSHYEGGIEAGRDAKRKAMERVQRPVAPDPAPEPDASAGAGVQPDAPQRHAVIMKRLHERAQSGGGALRLALRKLSWAEQELLSDEDHAVLRQAAEAAGP